MEVVDLSRTAPQLYSMGACGTAPVDGEVGVATCSRYKREEPAQWGGFWMEMGIYRGLTEDSIRLEGVLKLLYCRYRAYELDEYACWLYVEEEEKLHEIAARVNLR
ncbi:hypothetical protein OSTOST_15703 [Ostertagia ostertagi]